MAIRKRAFSLIELLIVMSIIGILVAIASVSYASIQKRSRDSRRIQDMKSIQNAFEQYYGDTNEYPTGCSIDTSFLPSGIPVDPKGDNYGYNDATCTATGYCFCALLESASGNSSDAACAIGTGSYYCVKQLQ
jgi:prepilin-type N-terminal cleavage/methylation domain-containing protein